VSAMMTPTDRFPKIVEFKTPNDLRNRFAELGLNIPVDDKIETSDAGSPMAKTVQVMGRRLSNRWCIHPMEGWDGTPEGNPTELTLRRWQRFGLSGAKLIWGGEAVAVRHEGRANPNQLRASEATKAGLAKLRETLLAAHKQSFGTTDDLLVGLQLTHSGRFCRPNEKAKAEPRILFHHPILDGRVGIKADDNSAIMTDADIDRLIDDFVTASKMAHDLGYDFVDLKACHGYLGHEFLGAHTRPGKYGGSLENRTRFLRDMVGRVRAEAPGLGIGVRISIFDSLPYEDDPATRVGNKKGIGQPSEYKGPWPYPYGFCVTEGNPLEPDLTEAFAMMEMLRKLDVRFINVTGGSPYYCPHVQRPAYYPPSDGYQPPEDPLIGVARQIHATRRLKERFPDMLFVGTGYTYLQDYLPHVAQAVVRAGWVDFVGLGRMVLSYPELPADSLSRGTLDTKHLCRTFSECTTGPRKGYISGCFPLDDHYKHMPIAKEIRQLKTS